MIVFMLLPSHTMSSGARADFGRLFNMTRYGPESLPAACWTRAPPRRRSRSMSQEKSSKASQNRDSRVVKDRPVCRHGKKTGEHPGRELKIKSFRIPIRALISQEKRNRTRNKILQMKICLRIRRLLLQIPASGPGRPQDPLPGSQPGACAG